MDTPRPLVEAIPELEPDIPPGAFEADNVLMYALIALATLLLLVAFGLLLWRAYGKKAAPAPPSPEAIALAELDKLEGERPPLRPAALRLSLILRAFLAGQAQDPALYETHEEFSLRIDSLAGLPGSCQHDMRCLLETLAAQKYAAVEAQDNPTFTRDLIGQARELVQLITREQARLAAERASES